MWRINSIDPTDRTQCVRQRSLHCRTQLYACIIYAAIVAYVYDPARPGTNSFRTFRDASNEK